MSAVRVDVNPVAGTVVNMCDRMYRIAWGTSRSVSSSCAVRIGVAPKSLNFSGKRASSWDLGVFFLRGDCDDCWAGFDFVIRGLPRMERRFCGILVVCMSCDVGVRWD